MRTTLLRSRVNLWFDYLKLADRLNLDVNWDHYKAWGTRSELMASKFGAWWNSKGQFLFEESSAIRIHDGKERSSGYVYVAIPAHWTVRQVRRDIGPVFSRVRTKVSPRGTGIFFITGRFSYGDFVSYKRLLELYLDARDRGHNHTMGDLLRTFRKDEDRRRQNASEKTEKSKERADQKKKKRYKKFPVVIVKVTANEQRNGYIWLKKAKQIAANVAKGSFPYPTK